MTQRKKRALIMGAVAVVSAITLGFTALAAYTNVSGYERMKAAAFKLMTMDALENCTIAMTMEATLDGQITETGTNLYALERAGVSRSETRAGDYDYVSYEMGDGVQLAFYDGEYGVSRGFGYGHRAVGGMAGGLFGGYSDLTDAQKRLMSAAADLLAGDTKNYFENDNGHITCAVTGAQLPELFQAAISVVSEESQRSRQLNDERGVFSAYGDDYNRIMNEMMGDLTFDRATLDATVTDDDLPTDFTATISFTGHDYAGAAHVMAVRLAFSITDIGTTTANLPDLTGQFVNVYGNRVLYGSPQWAEAWGKLTGGDWYKYEWPVTEPDVITFPQDSDAADL